MPSPRASAKDRAAAGLVPKKKPQLSQAATSIRRRPTRTSGVETRGAICGGNRACLWGSAGLAAGIKPTYRREELRGMLNLVRDARREPDRYSFTGPTRELTYDERQFIFRVIVELRVEPGTEFSSGGASGVDSCAARSAQVAFPSSLHRLILPAAPHANLVLSRFTDVIRAPIGHTQASAYVARNDLLVEHCDVLVAFPESSEEELRRGAWATIRRARDAGKTVHLHPLTDA